MCCANMRLGLRQEPLLRRVLNAICKLKEQSGLVPWSLARQFRQKELPLRSHFRHCDTRRALGKTHYQLFIETEKIPTAPSLPLVTTLVA